jgi:hypothetical protein
MKAQTSIDPKLIGLLGRKLYSSHPLFIVVRELLQNSVDACKRAGVDPDIKISIELKGSDKSARVICDDNGIGMSEEELVHNFLCLGGSDKQGKNGETGGFGIAKAAIMSGLYWRVDTLDLVVDMQDVLEGKEIHHIPTARVGTCVTVDTAEEYVYDYMLIRTLLLCLMSHIDGVQLIVKNHNVATFNDAVGDEIFGEKLEVFTSKSSKRKWVAYGVKEIEINDETMRGMIAVRMNGLVQYIEDMFIERMKGNIIVEVDSSGTLPEQRNYPFNMSREKLLSDYNTDIEGVKRMVKEQYESISHEIRTLEIPDIMIIIPGRLLKGKYEICHEGKVSEVEEEKQVQKDIEEIQRSIFSHAHEDVWRDHIISDSANMLTMLMNYDVNENIIEKDASLLYIWAQILEELLPPSVEFGIGLIGIREECFAMTQNKEGLQFYLINPNYYRNSFSEAIVLGLWTSACHEVAHLSHGGHNDEFIACESTYHQISKEIAAMNLSKWSKILRKVYEEERQNGNESRIHQVE